MPDLLIELFSEEIPARMQTRAADDLRKLVTDGLVEAGLTYAGAAAFSTPRRLTLSIEGLTAESKAVRDCTEVVRVVEIQYCVTRPFISVVDDGVGSTF